MVRRNIYVITGSKEWNMMYWQGIWINKGRLTRHTMMVNFCLDKLHGKEVVMGLSRQYGFQQAMKEAEDLYYNLRLSPIAGERKINTFLNKNN